MPDGSEAGPNAALRIVAGKGGVGRSTIAAALAVQAASAGRRVLLVDAVAAGGTAAALRLGPQQRGRAKPLRAPYDGITLLELGTEAALEEYVRLNLKFPISPRSLRPIAPIFDFVATAAPAVREILTIGKIGHEVRRGGWDDVIVDGPATGHIVELLASPRRLGDLVSTGPLTTETEWLAELLAETETTEVVVVALAEELPVSETEALLARIAAETELTVGSVIANRTAPMLGPDGEAGAGALVAGGGVLARPAAVARHRSDVARRELARLQRLGVPVTVVADRPDGAVEAAIEALGVYR